MLVATEDGGRNGCVSLFVEIKIVGVVHWAIFEALHIAGVPHNGFGAILQPFIVLPF